MGRHALNKAREPHQRYESTAKCRRLTLDQVARRGWYGQMGGIGVAAAVIAVPLMFGGAAIVAGIPLDLASPPSAPAGQRPLGPSWLPSLGTGLRPSSLVGNPLFNVSTGKLDASVASDPDVLRAALAQPLSDLSSLAPLGHWTAAGRWVSTDPIVRPTYPCPSPVLDPVGFRAWFARFFPGHPIPTPPVSTPPVTAPAQPPAALPASPPAATPPTVPVESVPEPVAAPEPQPEPVVDTTPVVVDQPVSVDPPAVDPPALDVPPVVIDTPVTPPVEVDVPPVDPPVVDLPPVTVDPSPVTDPITDALPDPVGDVVDGATSLLAAPDVTQQPVDANPVAPDVSKDATTGATESPVQLSEAPEISAPPAQLNDARELSAVAPHSTSGNGESYVGRHRSDADRALAGTRWIRVVDRSAPGRHHNSRVDTGGRHGRDGRDGVRGHRAGHAKSGHGGDPGHGSSSGKHHVSDSHGGGRSNHSGSHGSHGGGGHGRH